jgi:DNA-binding response OmpR family regulator
MNASDFITLITPPAGEAKLLKALAAQPEKLVSYHEVSTALYGDRDPANVPKSNVDQVLVGRLRKRMAVANCGWTIETVRGRGYRLIKLPVRDTEGGAA